ncbi:L-rhamnose/proton symporter RhaT [Membranicola marinus]|uniref:L-rhamnose/proton symporter RhaT n=1 Tax=Membranihabitans marinus TaxID=1227546 RepID=A0A953LB95_9BACT|nr:L-rhamnose/proton symporter RhaT [Membranihabitans marinus]MBY5959518.1 L-rhamnose/proton symporter RhaT [Membranihabitans marinus]
MNILIGVIYHFIGGTAAGSFYMPYTRVKKWAWETMWIVGGFFSWLIVPLLAAWLTVPGFAGIISSTSSTTLWWTYVMGIFWGIGGLTYGLGVRYLGMSLGNSVILGLTAAFGALLPSVYYDIFPSDGKVSFTEMLQSDWGQYVLIGVVICLVGIAVSGRAGIMKENELSAQEKEREKRTGTGEFNVGLGLIVAVVSGVLSACFNYGIEIGKPMADMAVDRGVNPLFQNNVIFVVLLWGGLTTNFIWCTFLNFKNKTYTDYTDKKAPLKANYLLSALAGLTWFLQFFFYGMGESKLGNGASSWIVHMAFIILVANVWGLVLKEWKGVSNKTLRTVILGILIIVLAIAFVGYGNGLKA